MIGAQAATDAGTKVEVRVERSPTGATVYHYVVTTDRRLAMVGVMIGLDLNADEPELLESPVGWVAERHDCPPSVSVPAGWTGCVGRQEESERNFIRLDLIAEPLPADVRRELHFSVTTARPDTAYETASFTVQFPVFPNATGRVVKVAALGGLGAR